MHADFDFHGLDRSREEASGETSGGFSFWQRTPQNWGLCESLIARSQACRYQDPEQMVLLAERAVAVAEGLNPNEYGRELAADLRARALAELANAYRVSDDLEGAERALRRAVEWSSRGTQDSLLLARIMRLAAALRGAQRRFDEALPLLDAVYELYQRHGDRSNAGRALISKGLYTGYSQDPEAAIRYLSAGLAMIHPASDPKLVLSAVHNLVGLLADCGRFAEARRLLERARGAYFAEGDRLNLIKLRWLEGRIAAGLGELEQAEEALLEAQTSLEEAGLGYHVALVSLDLAAVWLQSGRTEEVRRLIEKTISTFRARRIAREALASMLLLKESLRTDRSGLALLQGVRSYLKRLDSRPAV